MRPYSYKTKHKMKSSRKCEKIIFAIGMQIFRIIKMCTEHVVLFLICVSVSFIAQV